MFISNLSLNIPTIIISIIGIIIYFIIKFKINPQNINSYGVGLVYIFTIINVLLLIISLALNIFSLVVNINDADNNMIMIILNVVFIVFYVLSFLWK